MGERRQSRSESSETRTGLLNAAERLMVEKGYAAVSARKIAAEVGVNVALVYYYFANMDELFLALFRRGAERSLRRLEQALREAQPIWGLWELTHDFSDNALTMEFIALANHRKVVRAEIAAYSRRFRTLELERLGPVLEGYGVDLKRWPAASLTLVLAGISRFLLIEDSFQVDLGHAEAVLAIEQTIRDLEGPRRRSEGRAVRRAI